MRKFLLYLSLCMLSFFSAFLILVQPSFPSKESIAPAIHETDPAEPILPLFSVVLSYRGITCRINSWEDESGSHYLFLPKYLSIGEKNNKPEVYSHQAIVIDGKKLSAGALSLLFSNLARGCEKQYRPAEQKQYLEIAGFFASLARKEKAEGDLASIVSENLSGVYNDAEASASAAGDRGALRARLWSYKVEMIARTILSRYEKEGEKMLENTSVWVCSVCGFVFIGNSAPALCPVCKVPSWKFDKVE